MTEWLYSVLASFIVFSYSLTHCLGLDGLKISFTVGLAPKGARERWVPFEKFYDCVVVYSDVHYYMRAVFCFKPFGNSGRAFTEFGTDRRWV
jgi:hypothetical protein